MVAQVYFQKFDKDDDLPLTLWVSVRSATNEAVLNFTEEEIVSAILEERGSQ
jgi:hypothetical protein